MFKLINSFINIYFYQQLQCFNQNFQFFELFLYIYYFSIIIFCYLIMVHYLIQVVFVILEFLIGSILLKKYFFYFFNITLFQHFCYYWLLNFKMFLTKIFKFINVIIQHLFNFKRQSKIVYNTTLNMKELRTVFIIALINYIYPNCQTKC